MKCVRHACNARFLHVLHLCTSVWIAKCQSQLLAAACTSTGASRVLLQHDHARSRTVQLLRQLQMTTPGVEPGLSRPQRDVLTTR